MNTYCHYGLGSHFRYRKIVGGSPHTNNKIDLWAKRKGEEFVAHKLMHLNVFDDAVISDSCNALEKEIADI